MNKNYVKQVLKERIIICVQILLMYILGLFIGHSLGNTPPANMYTWRFYAAKGIVEILPLLILIKAKELITLLLDYFCMATMERELVIRLKEELIIGFFQEYRCEILSDKNIQRKYMIRQQKYEQAETQSQKEVQLSCMDDIKKEIDTLQAEIEEQVKERQLYEQRRKSLEEQISQTQD